MREILKQLINLLPKVLKDDVYHKLNKKRGRHQIKAWKSNGMPLPPPASVKQKTINDYQKEYKYEILIETGTFHGDMIEAQRKNFRTIYSIELSQEFWQKAVDRFRLYSHIRIIHGDSAKELFPLIDKIEEPVIFWLDGHYSAGNTAMGDKLCPVMLELEAILQNKISTHLILIDDAKNFIGANDYPSILEIENYIKSKNRQYNLFIKDDIIRIKLQ